MCRKSCLSLCAVNLRISIFRVMSHSVQEEVILVESKFLPVNQGKVILLLLT